MNERIKELAKQAEQAADSATYAYDDDTGKWQKIWNEVYDEKFAELLVRECADQCMNVLDYHAILERFGIKE